MSITRPGGRNPKASKSTTFHSSKILSSELWGQREQLISRAHGQICLCSSCRANYQKRPLLRRTPNYISKPRNADQHGDHPNMKNGGWGEEGSQVRTSNKPRTSNPLAGFSTLPNLRTWMSAPRRIKSTDGAIRLVGRVLNPDSSVLLLPLAFSRTSRELRKIGRTFFQVGVTAFLTLLGHVEEHGRVAGQFLEAGLAVAIGVHRGLEATNRHG